LSSDPSSGSLPIVGIFFFEHDTVAEEGRGREWRERTEVVNGKKKRWGRVKRQKDKKREGEIQRYRERERGE
jgi:hypothetical protein